MKTAAAGTLYLLHVLTHASRARLDGLLAEIGLTAFQYTLLSVVAQHAGLSSSSLSRRFHVSPQAMGDTILALERRGWVERRENPANRKILQLALTEAGAATVEAARARAVPFEAALFADCAKGEVETLRTVLLAALARVRAAA